MTSSLHVLKAFSTPALFKATFSADRAALVTKTRVLKGKTGTGIGLKYGWQNEI